MALNYSKNVNKVCNLSQYDSIFYIFEIEIKSDETTTIRRIKNSREGQLFNTDDMVDNNTINITGYHDTIKGRKLNIHKLS